MWKLLKWNLTWVQHDQNEKTIRINQIIKLWWSIWKNVVEKTLESNES